MDIDWIPYECEEEHIDYERREEILAELEDMRYEEEF